MARGIVETAEMVENLCRYTPSSIWLSRLFHNLPFSLPHQGLIEREGMQLIQQRNKVLLL